jgi:hypothetical protein
VGYPILDENAILMIPSKKVYPMNGEANKVPDDWDKLTGPIDGKEEAVYVHDMYCDAQGMTYAMAYNPKLQMGLGVSCKVSGLPKLLEWKSMGSTDYVLGLQPTNCFAAGRDYEISQETLKSLKPQQSEDFDVTLTVIDGEEDYLAFKQKINNCKY